MNTLMAVKTFSASTLEELEALVNRFLIDQERRNYSPIIQPIVPHYTPSNGRTLFIQQVIYSRY